MADKKSKFLDLLHDELREPASPARGKDKRHPVRSSDEYERIKREAAADVDELYEMIIEQIRDGISDIDRTVGPIAEPMAEQLAKGAVSDVFEAAAEVLKAQIRGRS